MKKTDKFYIVNASPYCIFNGKNYIDPAELISISQWFGIFGDITLLRPRLRQKEIPTGWLELPSDIAVNELCTVGDGRLRRYIAVTLNAYKYLRSADIIYVRMPNYEGYWSYRVAKKLKIKLLLELHGDWAGSILSEDFNGPIRILTRCYRAKKADKAVRSMVEYASLLITIGPALAHRYQDIHLPILVTTNHLLSKSSYTIREDFDLHIPPRIVFVGDIQRRKGLPYLFESLGKLKRLGRSFEMVVVGNGPLVAELTDYANNGGFLNSIVFRGRIPYGKELIDQIRNSDVLVLPSIGSEGVPRVTHEAMAVGCPVIAADIGSISWQLQDGSGVLIQPADANELTEAIIKVFDDSIFRRDLSINGRHRAEQFTLEMQTKKLQEFIDKNIDLAD